MEVEINKELIKILNSNPTVEQIRYLKNTYTLNDIDIRVCESIINQLSIIGRYNLGEILSEFNIDNDLKEKYNQDELANKIDDYVLLKKQEVNNYLLKSELENTSKDKFTKACVDVLYSRYRNAVEKPKNNSFADVRSIISNMNVENQLEYSSSIKYIDMLTNGLKAGTITTIVSFKNTYYKSLLALNIGYRAMLNKQNVLYVSYLCDKESVYRNFLIRHSKCNKFDKPFTISELKYLNENEFDLKNYENVCNDFEDNFQEYLIVYDKEDLMLQNHYCLNRLISYANEEFINRNGKGIDMIIIDNIDCARLEERFDVITLKSKIENEYYPFLISQATNLLSQKKKIPVIVTSSSDERFDELVSPDTDYVLGFISNGIKAFSDNIITVYGDEDLKRENILKVKLLKSTSDIMNESISITTEYDYQYIDYLDELKKENNSKKSEILQYQIDENENKNKQESNIDFSKNDIESIIDNDLLKL